MNTTKQKYQGDISIIPLEKLDNNLKFEQLKTSFVVREGEMTGHKHTLEAMPNSIVEIAKDEHGFYLKVAGGAVIIHEEHKPIEIGDGLYFLGRQYEFSEVEEYRNVMD